MNDGSASNFYQDFFERSPDPFCVANTEGYFTEVNPVFRELLGYTREEFLEQKIIDFVHPDDVKKTLDEIENLAKGHNTLDFRNRYRTKKGDYIILSWRARVQADGQIYAIARDITKRAQVEQNFKKLYDALKQQAIVAMTDKHGLITDVNDQFCKISEFTREELIGHNHRIISSHNHPKEFYKNLWETISSGKNWSGIIQNKKKSGDYYYVQTIITPLLDIAGNIESYLAVRFDITKRIKLRDDLQNILKILNETGSIAKVGGWELIVETGELNWTDETFNILEVEKKNDQKPTLPEGIKLFVPEHQPIIEEAIKEAIEMQKPYSLELLAQTAKGNVLWVYTNGRPNLKDGKVYSLSGTIQNIDARKKAEEALEQERLQSIQVSKLATLGEMAAGIAHEIKNPLSIINGSASLLKRKGELSEKMEKIVDHIEESCERITKIVTGLNKISRNSSLSDRSEINLFTLVEEVMTLLIPKVKHRPVKVINEVNKDVVIHANEIEMEQVLINLIGNAIDAIGDDENSWVKITAAQEHDCIAISVTDSGQGIDPKVANKLFNPFFTTKEVGKGTGLGLSISSRIAHGHQGNLKYQLKDGHTSFKLSLPINEKSHCA